MKIPSGSLIGSYSRRLLIPRPLSPSRHACWASQIRRRHRWASPRGAAQLRFLEMGGEHWLSTVQGGFYTHTHTHWPRIRRLPSECNKRRNKLKLVDFPRRCKKPVILIKFHASTKVRPLSLEMSSLCTVKKPVNNKLCLYLEHEMIIRLQVIEKLEVIIRMFAVIFLILARSSLQWRLSLRRPTYFQNLAKSANFWHRVWRRRTDGLLFISPTIWLSGGNLWWTTSLFLYVEVFSFFSHLL